jgi:deoxyribose-phosphate aldolase
MQPNLLARIIDHTLLKPEAEASEFIKLCEEAKKFSFATVCVRVSKLPIVVPLLEGSPTLPCAVIGFHTGLAPTEEKVRETREALSLGARELDLVMNRTLLKQTLLRQTYEDLRAVIREAKDVPVKVILETGDLSRDQIIVACSLSAAAGAAFVKTSTGYGPGGATVDSIKLMRETVGRLLGVKASGGVRTRAQALAMIDAGANRIGTSHGVAMMEESQSMTTETGGY